MLKKWPFILHILALVLSSSAVDAGKIFKWTDAEGNVHFGQRAPDGDKKAVAVKGAAASIRPSESGGSLYCGELRLHYVNRYRKYKPTAHDLSNKVKNWRKSLKRSQKNLSQYLIRISKINPNRSYRYSKSSGADFYERKDRLTKTVSQYACAIEWAEGKALSLKVGSSAQIEGHKKAELDLKEAKKQQIDICGREPTGYNKYGDERNSYKSWERCQRRYGSVVRKMEKNLRTAKKRLNQVN